MVDFAIAAQARPTPMTIDPGRALQEANALKQFQTQNQLRGILSNPDSIGPDGLPTGNALKQIMGIDPMIGSQLQQQSLRTQGMQTELFDKKLKLAQTVGSDALGDYEAAVAGGMPEPAAREAAQKTYSTGLTRLKSSGLYGEDEQKTFVTQFDPNRVRIQVQGVDQYYRQKEQTKKDAEMERHRVEQEKTDRERAGQQGTTVLQDSDGRPIVLKPNAPSGQPKATYIDGAVVPEDKLPGAHKMGTGASTSAANQDRSAITNVARSDYEKELGRPVNLADPNEKAELDRRVLDAEDKRVAGRAGAQTAARTAAQQAVAKPVPVTVNGVRQDALWRDGNYVNLDGTPIEGNVLGATRAEGKKTPGQEAENDAMAIADKRIAAKEKELGRPLDQAERAELRQVARADPKIQEVARKQDANAIDDDSAKLIAEESLRGDWHGTVGMGRNQASMRKIAEWRGRLAKENNMTGADLAANTAEFMGILAAERVLGTRGAGIDLGIAEAGKFAPMVLRASDMVDRTKFPTVNSLLLAAEKGTGGEAVIRLIDSLNAYKMAYTQILTRGGMPTDDSRRRADEIIDKAWSNGQIKTALDQLNQEMNGARSAVPEVRDNLYKALTGKSRTSPVDQVPSPVQGPQRTEQSAAPAQIPTITHDDAGKAAYAKIHQGEKFISDGGLWEQSPPGQVPKYLGPAPGSAPSAQPNPAAASTQTAPAAPQSAPAQQPPAPTQQSAQPGPRAAAPIPLKAGMKPDDLVDNQVYETARGAARWDKAQKKFFPVGSQ